MPLIILLAFLVVTNWVFSEIFVLFPVSLLSWLLSLMGWIVLIVLVILVSWFFGE